MEGCLQVPKVMAISNHGTMLGGGEFSFLDLVARAQDRCKILTVVPSDGDLGSRLREKALTTTLIPLPPLRPWFLHKMLKALAAYLRICLKFRPDLIYANGSRAALYGGITGRVLKIPMIWHCRIATSDTFFDFILATLATRIIANSRAVKSRFSPMFRSKVKVVYNGIDLEWIRNVQVPKPNRVSPHWKVLLSVGRISHSKRHDLVLVAFQRIAKSEPNAHLVLVGSPDALAPAWWDHLQTLSRRSGFSERIHWIGQSEDMRPWYRAASVLLMAAENESFGRVVVEAMACGVPVVAVRSGGVPEIVRDGLDGFLVSAGDISGIAGAVLKILRDDELRSRLSESALERAECFPVATYVQRVLRVFEETLEN
jgi:glycosyltransferase involved in cell wall biosynthesis